MLGSSEDTIKHDVSWRWALKSGKIGEQRRRGGHCGIVTELRCTDKHWAYPEEEHFPDMSSEVMCNSGLFHCCSHEGHNQTLDLTAPIPSHHSSLLWVKQMAKDRVPQSWVIYSTQAPKKSSLCAGEAPSSVEGQTPYPLTLWYKVLRSTKEVCRDAGAHQWGGIGALWNRWR